MRVALTDWLDKGIGISTDSEPERALLKERFESLKRQLPWLYGIVFVNVLGLHLALARDGPVPSTPVAILLSIVAIRALYWLKLSAREIAEEAVKREMRTTFLIAGFFGLSSCMWSVTLYRTAGPSHGVDIAMFASLAGIGCAYGMSSFPVAARLPVLLLTIPTAAMLVADGHVSHIGMGSSLILLCTLTLRLLDVQDHVFQRLVSSRFAVEAERKRAVEAERIAIAEQSRVGIIANTDALTGLANRRGFLGVLDGLCGIAGRPFALILLDLDGFKPINDTFGHPSGDAILVEVSRRLQLLERGVGAIGRLGGDEFAILVECSNQNEAMAIANRAVEALSRPFRISRGRMTISACAGVSFHKACDVGEVMRHADIALYEAKRSGRGSVALFSAEMEQNFQRRMTIEQALREPGLAGNIDLAFQPIFHLESMELRSFEALARWRHSELGWISPAEFIPITEQISVVHEMSNTLLRRAAAAAREWPASVRLSFNLSAVQMCSAGTAAKVLAIIAEQGVDPIRLQIEVTETALLADFSIARGNLSQLRQAGVRIALDDFGAGYSSISYLREMNFDAVKLDGSLISSIADVGSGLPLLRGVLALCRAMGQQCVAEHIETETQLVMLRQLGCRYGQGYRLGRPMDAAAAAKLVRGSSAQSVAA